MLQFIWGSAHSAFLRASPRAPRAPAPHSLSHRQLGPARQQHRRATAETQARRPRAQRPGRGRSGRGWGTARRSELGPTPAPTPRGVPAAGLRPLSAVPSRSL
jgi:hypothetical protein